MLETKHKVQHENRRKRRSSQKLHFLHHQFVRFGRKHYLCSHRAAFGAIASDVEELSTK